MRLIPSSFERAPLLPTRWRERQGAQEFWVGAVLVAAIFVFSQNFGIFGRHAPFYQHLGAEYYNIAAALVDGRGYSDPFGEVTGPTAWQPPVYPLLLAGLLIIFGKKVLVAKVIVVFTIAALSAVGMILFSIAKRCRMALSPIAIVAIYLVWLWAHYGWFFMSTHDIWLLVFLASLMTLALFQHVESQNLNAWVWGGLGGVTSLASPSLTFAWLGASIFIFVCTPRLRRKLALAAALAALLLSPWMIRNAIVFEKVVPSKSNLFYEGYLANCVDDDGVYDKTTFAMHPYVSPQTRFQYARLGEMPFIEEHKQKFLMSLRADPIAYAAKVATRAWAVSGFRFRPPVWEQSLLRTTLQQLISALPLLAILVIVRARGLSRFPGLIVVSCAFYFAPYVLVAFYQRYRLPMTAVFVIFIFIALDRLVHAHKTRTNGNGALGAN